MAAKFACATKRTLEWVIYCQREMLPKSKMVSSDDRLTFTIVHVLRFGSKLNEELCCRLILSLQIFNNH